MQLTSRVFAFYIFIPMYFYDFVLLINI